MSRGVGQEGHDELAAQAHALYERGGASMVYEWARERHPELPWRHCGPCEAESPVIGNACAVCATRLPERQQDEGAWEVSVTLRVEGTSEGFARVDVLGRIEDFIAEELAGEAVQVASAEVSEVERE